MRRTQNSVLSTSEHEMSRSYLACVLHLRTNWSGALKLSVCKQKMHLVLWLWTQPFLYCQEHFSNLVCTTYEELLELMIKTDDEISQNPVKTDCEFRSKSFMNAAALRGRECKCYVLLHFKMIWINLFLIFSWNAPLKMEYAFGNVTCMD